MLVGDLASMTPDAIASPVYVATITHFSWPGCTTRLAPRGLSPKTRSDPLSRGEISTVCRPPAGDLSRSCSDEGCDRTEPPDVIFAIKTYTGILHNAFSSSQYITPRKFIAHFPRLRMYYPNSSTMPDHVPYSSRVSPSTSFRSRIRARLLTCYWRSRSTANSTSGPVPATKVIAFPDTRLERRSLARFLHAKKESLYDKDSTGDYNANIEALREREFDALKGTALLPTDKQYIMADSHRWNLLG